MPYLKDEKTGDPLKSIIERVIESDYSDVENSGQFIFDWDKEKQNEVYKIYLIDNEQEILGMMSLVDFSDEYRIHLNLIEVKESEQGQGKKIGKIAGCLHAFACQLAFARGYDGFVSLVPKTKLINLYKTKYGFQQYGRLLCVEQVFSNALIKKYLADEGK